MKATDPNERVQLHWPVGVYATEALEVVLAVGGFEYNPAALEKPIKLFPVSFWR